LEFLDGGDVDALGCPFLDQCDQLSDVAFEVDNFCFFLREVSFKYVNFVQIFSVSFVEAVL
jgi:hypothetical protein